MSFVGTRPEAVKYVEKYKPEYLATLLLPAGITSEASIRYKDEAQLLDVADDVDRVYIWRSDNEQEKDYVGLWYETGSNKNVPISKRVKVERVFRNYRVCNWSTQTDARSSFEYV